MRLIDKDALIQQMKLRHGMIGRQSDPDCLVEDAPTVDAVPVVRCKDCKYAVTAWENGKGGYCCTNHDSPIDENCLIRPDFFCADGERKEDDGTR